MQKVILIHESHEKARIKAEEKYVNDRMVDMNDLDSKTRQDLLEKERKIEAKQKPEPVSLEEAGKRWNTLTKDEKEAVLMASVVLEKELEEEKIKSGIDRLPEDVRMIVNMSAKNLASLPGEGREKILFAMEKIHERKKENKFIDKLKSYNK
ncbi:hypothetical protein ES707_10218 [subsurface metagenome]